MEKRTILDIRFLWRIDLSKEKVVLGAGFFPKRAFLGNKPLRRVDSVKLDFADNVLFLEWDILKK